MTQAVLQELGRKTLHKYLERTDRIIFKTSEPKDFSASLTHVCSYHFIKLNRDLAIKLCTHRKKSNAIHFIQRVTGHLICYISVTEAVTLVRNSRYILTNRDITTNVTKSLDVINQAINNFDDPIIDLTDTRE